MARYVIRGTVRDGEGAPIEGAALDLGGEIVYTNSNGEFFLRARYPRHTPLKVLIEEFLLPGQWEIVSAPNDVTASEESHAGQIEIVLHRAPADAP